MSLQGWLGGFPKFGGWGELSSSPSRFKVYDDFRKSYLPQYLGSRPRRLGNPSAVNMASFETTCKKKQKRETKFLSERRLSRQCKWSVRSSVMLRSLDWELVTDVSVQPSVRFSRVMQSRKTSWTAWPLKMGPICSFETSVNIYQSRMHHIRVKLKPRISLSTRQNGLSYTRQTKEKFSPERHLDVKRFCQSELKKTPPYSSSYIPWLPVSLAARSKA